MRLNGVIPCLKGAGVELKRQSELWRETTAAAAEASAHVVAHSNLLLALEKHESAEERVAAQQKQAARIATKKVDSHTGMAWLNVE